MKTAQQMKLEDATRNEDKYIKQMSRWSDKKLEKHLNIFRIQKRIAWKEKKFEAYKLLCLYEDQVILARLKKFQ